MSLMSSGLDLVDPPTSDRSNNKRKQNKIPSMHTLNGIEFLCHRLLSMGISHSLMIRLWFGIRVNSIKEGLKIWGLGRGKRKCIPGRRTANMAGIMMGGSKSMFMRG